MKSEPTANVLVDGLIAGRTPLSIPLIYRGSMERFERRVSYWRTQPGLSIFLTLVSLGVYLPFSLIPLDPEERLQPVEHFEANHFVLRLEEGGYQPWERALDLTGEKEVDIQADLAPAPGPMQEAPL